MQPQPQHEPQSQPQQERYENIRFFAVVIAAFSVSVAVGFAGSCYYMKTPRAIAYVSIAASFVGYCRVVPLEAYNGIGHVAAWATAMVVVTSLGALKALEDIDLFELTETTDVPDINRAGAVVHAASQISQPCCLCPVVDVAVGGV